MTPGDLHCLIWPSLSHGCSCRTMEDSRAGANRSRRLAGEDGSGGRGTKRNNTHSTVRHQTRSDQARPVRGQTFGNGADDMCVPGTRSRTGWVRKVVGKEQCVKTPCPQSRMHAQWTLPQRQGVPCALTFAPCSASGPSGDPGEAGGCPGSTLDHTTLDHSWTLQDTDRHTTVFTSSATTAACWVWSTAPLGHGDAP